MRTEQTQPGPGAARTQGAHVHPSSLRCGRLVALIWSAVVASAPLPAGTLARWDFEPGDERQGNDLRGGGAVNQEGWVIARGAKFGPGKFGRALWPTGSDRAGTTPAPSWSQRELADAGRPAAHVNPTDTRLNLGAHDWTIECWLWLETAAAGEGVIYEIGSGLSDASELVTRFSVWPRENAFVLTGIGPVAPGEAETVERRIEFSDPAGPPDGVARLEQVTLGRVGTALPSRQWFHVALVYDVAAATLRLFLAGKLTAVAPLRLIALPRGPRAYLALGCDGRRARVLAGAIDDLRVSDHAAYVRDFLPDDLSRP